MTEQNFPFGGTAVADRPVDVAAGSGEDSVAGDNRRKLLIVLAAVGVLVVAGVAYFLLKSGGSAATPSGLVPRHAAVVPAAGTAGAAAAAPVTLPRKVAAPEGRNPFKALYTVPVAAAAPASSVVVSSSPGATPPSAGTTQPTSTQSTGGSTTSTTPTYHPVWVLLKSVTASTATFDVGYSNGKTMRTIVFRNIKAPTASGGETIFAGSFAMLSISNGQVVLKFGDGTPFRLDLTHNYMVVG